jgi:hypothetical protein
LVLAVVEHSAGIQNCDDAKYALQRWNHQHPWLKLIWASGGDAGTLEAWTKAACGWLLEIVRRRAEAVALSCCRDGRSLSANFMALTIAATQQGI